MPTKTHIDLESLKELLKDYANGDFELDSIYIDKDGWVATPNYLYSIIDEGE